MIGLDDSRNTMFQIVIKTSVIFVPVKEKLIPFVINKKTSWGPVSLPCAGLA